MKKLTLLHCAAELAPQRAFLLALALCIVVGCASSPSGGDAVSSAIEASATPKPSASLAALLATLKRVGYDGVGLEYESDSTLDFLNRVFQNPRVANRKIKLTYTGMALSYDAKAESLTIGGTTDVEAILKYVEKSIPSRPKPPQEK